MLSVRNLRCEYACNPLGLDVQRPRLSWILSSDRRGTAQVGYRVRVAESAETLAAGRADVWDSGRVASDQSVSVEYAGDELHSGQRCYWTVEVWDNHGCTATAAEAAWFEMGLLHPEDWQAVWIGSPACLPGRSLLVVHDFKLAKPVRRARAYVAGIGYHYFHINGQAVGDHVLDPAPTDYAKRVLYVTHDVTALLREGGNVIGAELGNGWYGMPKLLLQLNIEFTDGTCQVVATQYNWPFLAGPTLSNSIYDGEVYDARAERPGWDSPGYSHGRTSDRLECWFRSLVTSAPGGKLASQMLEPIRVVDTLRPVGLSQPLPGVWVFDLGQNFAGWARLRVQGPAGTRITLRFGETCRDDGMVNQDNLLIARAEDVYILKGNGVEQWEPRFTYHGFRYVQVQGWPGEPTLDSLDGRVVRSSVARRGRFECSSDLINRIHRAILWTEGSNLHGIPTDCPQRSERLGWLNDMTARSEEAIYNYEMPRFITKFMDDLAENQDAAGTISDTVPYHVGNRPADPVSVCYLLLPWLMYQHYGDRRLIERHYAGMKAWVDYLTTRTRNHIVQYSYWGDWAPPAGLGRQVSAAGSPASAHISGQTISTGMYYYQLVLLARMAGLLGRQDDRQAYERLAEQVAEAFNREFWNEQAGGYGLNSQSSNCLALYLDLVPTSRRARVLENLVRSVMEEFGGHLTTGNICTKYLPEALSRSGRSDVSWRLVTQEDYPSWGHMLANGATTMWERWELATGGGMNSHNHAMLASIGAWFYRVLAGLRVDESGPGWRAFVVQPHLVTGLDWVSAELPTVRGLVKVSWRRRGRGVEMDVTIPANARARVFMPTTPDASEAEVLLDGQAAWRQGALVGPIDGVLGADCDDGCVIFEMGSGEYHFICE